MFFKSCISIILEISSWLLNLRTIWIKPIHAGKMSGNQGNIILKLVFCSNRLNCPLGNWHSMSDGHFNFWLFHFQTSYLLTRRGRQGKMGQLLGSLSPTRVIKMDLLVPGYEPADEKACFLSSVTLPSKQSLKIKEDKI